MIRFFAGLLRLSIPVVLSVSVAAMASPRTSPPATRLITQAIDPARTLELPGNVRPEAANPAYDRGAVADDFALGHLLLQLKRPAERDAALAALIEQQQDPVSANYHAWLDATQIGDLYGPAPADIDTIVAWLQAQGFAVDRVYESGMTIAFSATAGLVRTAFGTDIHRLEVDGQAHYANVRNPRIPAALAPAVAGIVALHDFRPRPQLRPKVAPAYTISGGAKAIVPADLATIYNLNPLFTAGTKGQGVTIALMEDTDVYSTADVTTFRSTFGLGAGTFTQTHPGCTDPGAVIGRDAEATLDVEWAAAAAPGATLQLVSCANLFDAIANLVNANATPPAIMSISYGQCEALLGASANAFVASTYQQAAAKGISVFVSSGDEGAASCDAGDSQATHGIGVSGLASTPYNVAVGGTDFGDTFANTAATYWNNSNTATFGSAKSYINEIPWNDSCASQLIATFSGFAQTYGSGGFCNSASGTANFLTVASASGGPSGCSSGTPSTGGVVSGSCAGTAKPSWQSGLFGNPADGVRDLPDVSLFAANGVWDHYYVYCFSDPRPNPAHGNQPDGTPCTGAPSGWSGGGGTSFSAPILAGIQALVNQKSGVSQGNPNPAYYLLAGSEYGAGGSSNCDSGKGSAVAGSCVFYDVTQGDIDVNCASGTLGCYRPSGTNGVLSTSTGSYQPAFRTTAGWDFATGIGTLNAANLVANWPQAAKVNFTTEPANGVTGVALAPIVVTVENASGNAVVGNASAVTLKLANNPGGATLGGTLTRNAVNGVATFNNITLSKAGTGYTLTATDGSLTSDTSTAFNVVSAAAAKLAFTTQPPSTAVSGAGFGVAVAVQDAAGNTVAGNSSTVTIALTPGGATLSGTTAKAASGGVATFSGLSIDKVGTYTLTATDGSLTSAVSTTIAITHGAAAKLAFTTQPPASAVSGVSFGTVVTVQDAAGNTVTGNSSQVGVALTSANGAALGGTKSVAASNGVATFSGLSIAKAGNYTLTATDGVLTAAVSSGLTITPGPAANIVFTTQPVNPLAGVTFGVAVSVEDAAGNVETGDSATQVTLSTNLCSNAVLRTQALSAGVAQFPNLRFYAPGSSRQLTAQASNGFGVSSTTFSVLANADLVFDGTFAACTP